MGNATVTYSAPADVDASHYEYRVRWSAEDEEYVATTVEWGPGLSWLDESPEAALEGLRRVVEQSIAALQADGKPAPPPLADRSYSGRLNLRLPPLVHAQLAREAAEDGLSLNALLVSRLTRPA